MSVFGTAKADWIKIMHDDDWFSGPESLRIFADPFLKVKHAFYFSAYSNVFPDGRLKSISLRLSQLTVDLSNCRKHYLHPIE